MTDSSSPPRPCARLRVLHHEARPGVAVIRPTGEMDTVGGPAVVEQVRALSEPGGRVVLDMRLVTFVDARGIRALLDGHRAARDVGARLVVVGPDQTVRRVLRICDPGRELTVMEVPEGEQACGVELAVGPVATGDGSRAPTVDRLPSG
ncbi:STAS domain-containing protein [Pseudonocardia sp. KRD291]|uniref:STAS domain-containing protein n=1 Tax=Pseudonocardia sp. KRD291 TaxID=2792007 RepID=UPI001C49F543|nr:STAS domain-containing protein [Pseudonocardia sp. KRD291]MBW0106305.1 STAS domain-containing protein [Pseudonocardia sp. KRD291]